MTGFYGSNNWENSQVDSILDMLEDLHQYVGKLYTCEDPDERVRKLSNFDQFVKMFIHSSKYIIIQLGNVNSNFLHQFMLHDT